MKVYAVNNYGGSYSDRWDMIESIHLTQESAMKRIDRNISLVEDDNDEHPFGPWECVDTIPSRQRSDYDNETYTVVEYEVED